MSEAGINVGKVTQRRDMIHIIVNEDSLDQFFSESNLNKLKGLGVEVLIAPEYKTKRTVIVRNAEPEIVDQLVGLWKSNKKADCQNKIKVNKKVHETEGLEKIAGTSLMKIMFKQISIANKAVKVGIQLIHQTLLANSVEKEVFISVVPCYRCFSYSHFTTQCPREDNYKICSECSREGHYYTQCRSQYKKCINCKNDHRTLAAVCPIRKGIVQTKTKEVRDRNKTNNTAQQKTLNAPTETLLQQNKDMATTTIQCLVYARLSELDRPGSFRSVANEMFGLNGLNSLVFPREITVLSHLNVDMPDSEIKTREMSTDIESNQRRKAKRSREGEEYPDRGRPSRPSGEEYPDFDRGKYDLGSFGFYQPMTARDRVMDWSMSSQSCTTPAQSPIPSSKHSTSYKSQSQKTSLPPSDPQNSPTNIYKLTAPVSDQQDSDLDSFRKIASYRGKGPFRHMQTKSSQDISKLGQDKFKIDHSRTTTPTDSPTSTHRSNQTETQSSADHGRTPERSPYKQDQQDKQEEQLDNTTDSDETKPKTPPTIKKKPQASGAVSQGKFTTHKQKNTDPLWDSEDVILLVPREHYFPETYTQEDWTRELSRGKYVKCLFQNKDHSKTKLMKALWRDEIDLKRCAKKGYVERDEFESAISGAYIDEYLGPWEPWD